VPLSCSPLAFVTSRSLAGTCPPAWDKELLSLKQHKSTRIITPATMVELLAEADSGEKRKDK
jgi:hypothetical protein